MICPETFEEPAALEFTLGGVPVDAVISSGHGSRCRFQWRRWPSTPRNCTDTRATASITAADLTLNNLLTTFQVSAAGSVVIPIDTSFIQDLLIANEIFAGFALRERDRSVRGLHVLYGRLGVRVIQSDSDA
jgi:hypothetical protein